MKRAATAGAPLVLNVHHLLDPLEMGGQRAAIGLAARTAAFATGAVLDGNFGVRQRYLDAFDTKAVRTIRKEEPRTVVSTRR